jgi:DNA-binding IclR family transcriptional regulator
MDILDLVGQSQDGLTLTELAGRLRLKTTTVHNLARTLAACGYLHKQGRGGPYRLGRKIDELAEARRGRGFLDRARRVLIDLHRSYPSATVILGEIVGREVAARLRISPERSGVVEEPGHQVMAPYTSATSLAFQGFWRRDQREAYRRDYPFEEFATMAWNSPEQLDAFLDGARQVGAVVLGPDRPSGIRIAAPAFSETHELLGVVGLSAPREVGSTTRKRQKLIDAVRTASATLGRSDAADASKEMQEC